jgi:sulfide dehydrogenase cytochrome subunit
MVKRHKFLFLLAAAALTGSFVAGQAQAQMASGSVLINTCYSCHGTDGKSSGAMPTIAGKAEGYVAKKLKAFRDGREPSTVMGRIAKGFGDDEIAALAKAFGKKM